MTANTLKAIARAASSALNRIRPRAEQRYSDAGDFGVHQLTLIELEPLIAAHNQEKYEPIVRWLSGALSNVASRQILKNALSEWRGATKGYCISLDAVQDVLGLVVLLKATGIPRQRILITHRCPEARLRLSIRQLGWHLRHEEVVRRGLPRIRLHICSVDAVSPGAIDGAISIKGLLGLLAAAEAWLAAREGTAPE